jgi:phosphoribosylformylglycinamidine synthase
MFDETYRGNPLVNVFCLGLAKHGALVKGRASGAGNPVYYVGAKTGRDGIHGATMASAEFDDKSAEKRPAVQVGDPFMEKLLLEACLEVMATDACVGVQDMGAAGLTCATSETGSRGGVGIEIDVALVPQRETGMTPYEVMLSESQERMLLIVKRGREAEVEQVFAKWDLHAVRIGQVTGDGRLRVKADGVVVADVPNRALTDEAPVYHRPFAPPEGRAEALRMPERPGAAPPPRDAFLSILGAPTVASKRWIYEQYDSMVRTNTIAPAGSTAGVVRVKGTARALAMSVDGNGRFVELDPRQGARLAVAEAARNVACTGATPIGATNCLNFGNPERPAVMWQFAEAVAGIGDACRALGIPITGGNVSLYNETDGRAVLPTPVIGVVGVIDDASAVVARAFPDAGLDVIVLGEGRGELGGSEYLKSIHGLIRGVPPVLDLAAEHALQALMADLAGRRLVRSAHDCAEGGIAVTLAECCFEGRGLGVSVDIPPGSGASGFDPATEALFGESASRIVLSVRPADRDAVLAAAAAKGVPARHVGTTGGRQIAIAVGGITAIACPVAEAEARWATSLSAWLDGRAA